MATIIAICPYCRAGGVRASETALGSDATCPKCKSSFTIIPSDDIPPDWDKPAPKPEKKAPTAVEAHPTATTPEVVEKASSKPPAADSVAPQATASVKTQAAPEPSLPAPAPQVDTEEAEPTAPPDMGMVFALAALILVGPAMLATLFPYGRFIAVGLAGVGFVGGLVCLGAEGKARLTAAGAVFGNFLALVFVIFLPSWLNLDPWSGPLPSEEPKGPMAIEHGTGKETPVSAGDWLDASRTSWQFRDVRVTARSGVGPVELHGPKDAKRTTKEKFLHLTLQVQNVGFSREIPLSGWAAGQGTEGLQVTDANGKPLAPAKFPNGWTPDPGTPASRALPGHGSEVVLMFTAPPAKTDHVRVQLSGAALGLQDEIKFRTGTGAVLPHGLVP